MLWNGNQVFADLWSGSYTERTVLSGSEEQLRQRLEKHVWKLASDIGPRNTARSECLQEAAAYVQDQFQRSGFSPTSQEFSTFTGHRVRNIEATIPGVDLTEAIVVGAHYDSIDIPEGCPGANDNASGVAALIEMAAHCAQKGAAAQALPSIRGLYQRGAPVFWRRTNGQLCVRPRVETHTRKPHGDDLPGDCGLLFHPTE